MGNIKKILVIGSNGMAGHIISLYLSEKGYDVTCVSRSKKLDLPTIILDVKNLQEVKKIVLSGYDYIINCVGILNEKAEKNKFDAVFINSLFPHFLADCTKNLNSKVIHLSTDCVFSGKKGGYSELDSPDGETFYDRTKAIGELKDNKNITFRNSIIGPDINYGGVGLFNWFMNQKGQINGYANVLWNGITTLELAKIIEKSFNKEFAGLISLVPNRIISKYDLLSLLNTKFKSDSLVINKDSNPISNKTLVNVNKVFDYGVIRYENMINELYDWILKHKNIYTNYEIE
jgi:dTDP-4-dehydrorhamnose reductase